MATTTSNTTREPCGSNLSDIHRQLRQLIVPKCTIHDRRCYIKTGTREGASKGRSFFICSNDKDQCSFATFAKDVRPAYCTLHGEMNELQTVVEDTSGKSTKKRWYYRCNVGRRLGKGWCGLQDITPSPLSQNYPLRDITGTINIPENKNPHYKDGREKVSVFSSSKTIGNKNKQDTTIKKDIRTLQGNNEGGNQFSNREVGPNQINDFSQESDQIYNVDNASDMSKHHKKPSPDIECVSSTAGPTEIQSNKDLLAKINKEKNLFKNVDLSTLPDQGQKLKAHISHLKYKPNNNMLLKTDPAANSSKPSELNQVVSRMKYESKPAIIVIDAFPVTDPSKVAAGPHRSYLGNSGKSQAKYITKGTIEALLQSLKNCPAADDEAPDPKGLLVSLMPHQRQALAWMKWREAQLPAGGILADDMGLGKTLTLISLLLSNDQKSEGLSSQSTDCPDITLKGAGTLIICPASLIYQWKKEIEKRVKPLMLTLNVFHGQDREKHVLKLARYNVVLTSYSIVSAEWKKHQQMESHKPDENGWLSKEKGASSLGKFCDSIYSLHWNRIILDEAHNIKNHRCSTSQAVCDLKAINRWAATGTPIQNEIGDFYSLIKFLHCVPFDDLRIWKKDVDNKTKNGRDRLNMLVKCLLMRRTKKQLIANHESLISLPARNDVTHSFTLREREQDVYNLLYRFSRNMLQIFLSNSGSASNDGSKDAMHSFKGNEMVLGHNASHLLHRFSLNPRATSSSSILLMVLRLRQCCSHMSMMCEKVDQETCKTDGVDTAEVLENFKRMSLGDPTKPQQLAIPHLPQEFNAAYLSSKISALLSVVKDVFAKNTAVRCVVVSQWTRMLAIVRKHFERGSFKTESIDGSVTLKRRSEIVDQFNSNAGSIQVLFVSLKAGGVGLNLIGGSHLFLLDQHWNPALEEQACDRIYRVGQKKDVWIHRFLCSGTVEEKIVTLQRNKRALAASVIEGGTASTHSLTFNDLRMMFGV